MDKNKLKKQKKQRRHRRVRAKISGTAQRPRLSVFRSHRGLYVQLIDDAKGHTLVSAHSREIKKAATGSKNRRVQIAYELGKLLAEKAKEKGIVQAVFDRGGYKYHGRVKAIAEGARQGGLNI